MNLHKSLNKVFVGLEGIVKDNIYTTKFLSEYEGDEQEEETKEDEEMIE